MKKVRNNLDKFLKVYLLIATFLLALGFYNLYRKVDSLSSSLENTILPAPESQNQNIDVCGPDCKKEIQNSISAAVATLSAGAKTVAPTSIPSSPTITKTQTVYIPLAGPVTTTSTDWVDVPGTDTYIDIVSDYGRSAKVSWDTFLSVANSNGQAFARLYDATHGIAVDNSVVSIENKSALTQVTSGNLNLWSGKNVYRVQIKSLNSFTVTFGSGRIKISY